MYLVFKCIHGFVPGSIFKTLSDPAVNGPVTQVPTVRTVTEPGGIKTHEGNFIHLSKKTSLNNIQFKAGFYYYVIL